MGNLISYSRKPSRCSSTTDRCDTPEIPTTLTEPKTAQLVPNRATGRLNPIENYLDYCTFVISLSNTPRCSDGCARLRPQEPIPCQADGLEGVADKRDMALP
ncbi:hypothetical protein ABEB36_006818 [Hypothenemus hampei]|uniref:Uncharacterized protein n=1 Tax=Hypothenemus hampei TaxID=57062 RepID=A0ABD1ERV6_HYPHA